jgi:hypothetical protein
VVVLGILAAGGLLGWRKSEQRKILTKAKNNGKA